ncbi:MAG: hypothetical protein J7L46_05815 [Bacteroidales bacterium]|nr:hypothetical protein [Bacteroidales bacterium]
MKRLIVSATEKEVQPLLDKAGKPENNLFPLSDTVDILITGAGSIQTIYNLLAEPRIINYNQLINVGVAGSFSPSLAIGTVVEVIADTFGDFGVDDNGQFIPAGDVGLMEKDEFPFTGGWLKNSEPFDVSLPQVKGITVQTTSGSIALIEKRQKLFNPGIETMESAAFFYIGLKKNISFTAIRCVSNRVEPRNKKNWNMNLAINNLNNYLNEKIIG